LRVFELWGVFAKSAKVQGLSEITPSFYKNKIKASIMTKKKKKLVNAL
jgi:hypothetical protein